MTRFGLAGSRVREVLEELNDADPQIVVVCIRKRYAYVLSFLDFEEDVLPVARTHHVRATQPF